MLHLMYILLTQFMKYNKNEAISNHLTANCFNFGVSLPYNIHYGFLVLCLSGGEACRVHKACTGTYIFNTVNTTLHPINLQLYMWEVPACHKIRLHNRTSGYIIQWDYYITPVTVTTTTTTIICTRRPLQSAIALILYVAAPRSRQIKPDCHNNTLCYMPNAL